MTEGFLLVRDAQHKDSARLTELMRCLAELEGYLDQFCVTQAELDQRLFKQNDVHVLVAEHDKQIIGMLVYYYLPFTYDLKPWIYIKELYVEPQYRSMKAGRNLMQALAKKSIQKGVSKIRWDVLSTNKPAKDFYQSLGAEAEDQWALYSLTKKAIQNLAI